MLRTGLFRSRQLCGRIHHHIIARTASPLHAGAARSSMLDAKPDAYGGVLVDPSAVAKHTDPDEFRASLVASLTDWRRADVRGVWLKLPMPACAGLVPVSSELGFEPHHAERDYIMMTAWLPTGAPCTLPPNASHQCGVGMFVPYTAPEDGKTYVLCVQERNGVLKGKGVWKMPTGLVNAREDITEAAVREVEEECGLAVKFESVIALRQSHGWAFGKSDMFFVVACSPVVPPGSKLKDIVLSAQASEIEAVTWRTMDEFSNEEFFQGRPLFRRIMRACRAYADGSYAGLRAMKLGHGLSDREDLLMFGQHDEEVAAADASDVWMS
jgi:ADP-ribose pyrophosphatase YjhB (NUDIX family)